MSIYEAVREIPTIATTCKFPNNQRKCMSKRKGCAVREWGMSPLLVSGEKFHRTSFISSKIVLFIRPQINVIVYTLQRCARLAMRLKCQLVKSRSLHL